MNHIKNIKTEEEYEFYKDTIKFVSDNELARNKCNYVLLHRENVNWSDILLILICTKNTTLLEHIVLNNYITIPDSILCLSGSSTLFSYVEYPEKHLLEIVCGGNDDIIDSYVYLPDMIQMLIIKGCTVASCLSIFEREFIPNHIFYTWCVSLGRFDIINELIETSDEMLYYVLEGYNKLCPLDLYKKCHNFYKEENGIDYEFNDISSMIELCFIEEKIDVLLYLICEGYIRNIENIMDDIVSLNINYVRIILDKFDLNLIEIDIETLSKINNIETISYIYNMFNITHVWYEIILERSLMNDNYICTKYLIDCLGISVCDINSKFQIIGDRCRQLLLQ